jgi:protein SCO1/2
MFKNKSYIGISFIILVFGILVIPKIIDRIKNNEVVSGVRLDKVSKESTTSSSLVVIGKAPQFSLKDQNSKT